MSLVNELIKGLLPEELNLVQQFRQEAGSQQCNIYDKRDNCGPAALDFISWAESKGIKDLKRIDGFFKADIPVSSKRDFTSEMKQQFLKDGGNWDSAKERFEWVSNSQYAEQWKYIPHYWVEDTNGKIYDPTGQQQFINKGYAKDLNPDRYTLSDIQETFSRDITEEKKKVVAVYGGGFKPPTSGHFEVVKQALKENPEIDEFIILIGGKPRNGITPDESILIWDIYKTYLPFKVEVKYTSVPPIKGIYNYAKEHPDEEVLFIIGAREGNEEDFKDIASRTTTLDKYPNLNLRTIVTQGGVSGTAARNASKISLDKFKPFVPSELSDEEVEQVYNIVADKIQENDPEDGKAVPYGSGYKKLNENASYSQNIDVMEKIAQLTNHMIDKGMNIEPLPTMEFIDGDSENAKDFFGKTAYYDPNRKHIVLYTEGRHPKDIVRSYAHEMIHHIQNLEGRLGDISTTNTQEDDKLNDIEAEANLKGTMTFRNWTDSLNEAIVGEKIECDNCGWSWNIVDGGDDLFICHKCWHDNAPINEKKNKDPFGLNAYARELAMGLEENEKVMDYKIYCDMDGVLADFERGYEELTGIDLKGEFKKGDDFWDPISEKGVGFWAGLKWMPDGQELWDYLKPYKPDLLSAPSREDSSRIGKHVWVKHKLPGTKLILRYAKQKQELATPESILIDDRQPNIDQWIAAGGIGILHTSTENTIKQLQNLGL